MTKEEALSVAMRAINEARFEGMELAAQLAESYSHSPVIGKAIAERIRQAIDPYHGMTRDQMLDVVLERVNRNNDGHITDD